VERSKVAYATKFAWCLKRVIERALLEMLGMFCAEKTKAVITPYPACETKESCKERIVAISGMRWPVACHPVWCPQAKVGQSADESIKQAQS
jgi:hypothetical protein